MQVALYSRDLLQKILSNIRLLLEELKRAEIEAIIYEPFFTTLQQHIPFDNVPHAVFVCGRHCRKNRLLVSLSGDGTPAGYRLFMCAIPISRNRDQFGRLGFPQHRQKRDPCTGTGAADPPYGGRPAVAASPGCQHPPVW